MKFIVLFIVVAGISSCVGDDEVKPESDGFTTDTSTYGGIVIPQNDPSFYGFDSSVLKTEEGRERLEKRKLLYMGIDSTYFAINEIEKIKNEMSSQSAVSFSVAERNLKSKALLKLNLIENTLTRQVDSALLINLKIHTSQLQKINENMAADVEHLKDISEKLGRVAKIMDRITDVLALCVSKGIIKPATPVTQSPAIIKATLPN